MGIEIERRFLPHFSDWKELATRSIFIKQGYIAREENNVVRIRIEDDGSDKKATLCVKGPPKNGRTPEFEYRVPITHGQALMNLCGKRVLTKRRYYIQHEQYLFEVDKFLGPLESLVVIEVELPTPKHKIMLPHWVGKEVTTDRRYTNASLVEHGIPK